MNNEEAQTPSTHTCPLSQHGLLAFACLHLLGAVSTCCHVRAFTSLLYCYSDVCPCLTFLHHPLGELSAPPLRPYPRVPCPCPSKATSGEERVVQLDPHGAGATGGVPKGPGEGGVGQKAAGGGGEGGKSLGVDPDGNS